MTDSTAYRAHIGPDHGRTGLDDLCPVDDCDQVLRGDHLMCPRHWFMVPKMLRDQVWDAWRQRCAARDRPAGYAAARDRHEQVKAAAIRAVNEKVNARVP